MMNFKSYVYYGLAALVVGGFSAVQAGGGTLNPNQAAQVRQARILAQAIGRTVIVPVAVSPAPTRTRVTPNTGRQPSTAQRTPSGVRSAVQGTAPRRAGLVNYIRGYRRKQAASRIVLARARTVRTPQRRTLVRVATRRATPARAFAARRATPVRVRNVRWAAPVVLVKCKRCRHVHRARR